MHEMMREHEKWLWRDWTSIVLGLWLLTSPVALGYHSAAMRWNDVIAGAFAIAFGVLVPMMPGKAHHMVMMAPGPDLPPGWSYNPSTWLQRAPPIALAFLALQ
jgi:hypothetical protein